MGISKSFALFFILIMAISSLSLMMVKPAYAQSIPTPSVPEFTVQYHFNIIAPTYTINPYTGQNETVSTGPSPYNQTIEFTIKNQPFTPYTDSNGNNINLYYNFAFKGQFETNWNYYPFNYDDSSYPDGWASGWANGTAPWYYSSSNSTYTVVSINEIYLEDPAIQDMPFPNGAQVDFQVQAKIGFLSPQANEAGAEFEVFNGQTSNWSNTQTVTINQVLSSPSPTATVPEFPTLIILPLFAIVILLSTVFIRKRIPKKNITFIV